MHERVDMERHLREQGCLLFREGGEHSIWLNPSQRKIASDPAIGKSKRGQLAQFASSLKFLSPDTCPLPVITRPLLT